MKKKYLSPQIQLRIQAQIDQIKQNQQEEITLETRNLLKRARKIMDQQQSQSKSQVSKQQQQPFNASPNYHFKDFKFKVDKHHRNYSYNKPTNFQANRNRTYTDNSHAFYSSDSNDRVNTTAYPRIFNQLMSKCSQRNEKHQFITEIGNLDTSLRQYLLQQRDDDDDIGPKYLTRYPKKRVFSFQKKDSNKKKDRQNEIFFKIARKEEKKRKKLKDGDNPYLLYKSYFKFEKVHSQEWINY